MRMIRGMGVLAALAGMFSSTEMPSWRDGPKKGPRKRKPSRYMPHQGKAEKARRVRQMEGRAAR